MTSISALILEILKDYYVSRVDITNQLEHERRILSTVFTVLRMSGILYEVTELECWRHQGIHRSATVKGLLVQDGLLLSLARQNRLSEICRELTVLLTLRDGYSRILMCYADSRGLNGEACARITPAQLEALNFPDCAPESPLYTIRALRNMTLIADTPAQTALEDLVVNIGRITTCLTTVRIGGLLEGADAAGNLPSALGPMKAFWGRLGPRLPQKPILARDSDWSQFTGFIPPPKPKVWKANGKGRSGEPLASPVVPGTPDMLDHLMRTAPDAADPVSLLVHRRDFIKSATGPHILSTHLYHVMMAVSDDAVGMADLEDLFNIEGVRKLLLPGVFDPLDDIPTGKRKMADRRDADLDVME